jgi:hypothetical protein
MKYLLISLLLAGCATPITNTGEPFSKDPANYSWEEVWNEYCEREGQEDPACLEDDQIYESFISVIEENKSNCE